ncbi:MAG TPA: flippase activity-associated protein Agl23, partial [Chloroflexota bacterium]|nr:flippase activity-associated protein Agl23 [Chloroflexota bacterium]
MSARRPGRKAEELEVAPDEEGFEEESAQELDELDEDVAAEQVATAAPPARTNGRGNGHGAVVERPAAAEPAAAPARQPLPAALSVGLPEASAGELTLARWLGQRGLYGLTYWQMVLVGLLIVALFLTRFYNLGERAMHHDESMHAKFAWDTFHGQVYKYNPLLHGPFQFLAVASSFWMFGATEATARAVPAAFGVALVGLTFLWRRWLGTAGWLFAIAIFTFSPSFTYFSRMLREDSYTATWTLLAATGFVGYALHRTRPWFYAFCVGLAFAFCTKESTYITAFIFGTFMIVSALWENLSRTSRRILAGACAGGLIGVYLTAVAGVLGKGGAREIAGALAGVAVGGLVGYFYDQLSREPAPSTARRGSRVRSRRRPSSNGEQPLGTFSRAFLTLWQDRDGFWGYGTLWGGVIVFVAIFVIFFTSLFTNVSGVAAPKNVVDVPGWISWLLGIFRPLPPRGGIMEGLVGSIQYWLEQHGVQRGNQPWFYYLLLLGAYETLPWLFGIVATLYYLRPGKGTWLTTFLIWWWALALTIYSWAGEKMPWLIIHITTPLVLLSARYLGELFTSATREVREKRIAFGSLAVLAVWTIHTGWPVNFERPDTPKDILVYTQTAPDVKKVVADLRRISLEQTGDEYALGVTVTQGPSWPFSWYLRDFKNAEYPASLAAQATKPVVLIAAEDLEKNRPFLQGYTGTKYKMRWWYPEDYRTLGLHSFGDLFSKKDVRDGLWKWLIYRETTQPLGSYDFYVYLKDGLGPSTAGAGGTAAAPTQAAGARVDPTVYEAKRVE